MELKFERKIVLEDNKMCYPYLINYVDKCNIYGTLVVFAVDVLEAKNIVLAMRDRMGVLGDDLVISVAPCVIYDPYCQRISQMPRLSDNVKKNFNLVKD